ncbi:MAG: GtrA family protein [Lachnospiraceae bacterium]|nr:GtrA family protein [Lachnospiraceae bacterium]
MNRMKKMFDMETVRYLVIGAMTTGVNFVLCFLCDKVLALSFMISNVISISGAILFAYFANKFIVFRNHKDNKKQVIVEFFSFIATRLVSMALELFFVWLTVEVMHIYPYVGKVITQGLVIITNYCFGKWVVFRKQSVQERN